MRGQAIGGIDIGGQHFGIEPDDPVKSGTDNGQGGRNPGFEISLFGQKKLCSQQSTDGDKNNGKQYGVVQIVGVKRGRKYARDQKNYCNRY